MKNCYVVNDSNDMIYKLRIDHIEQNREGRSAYIVWALDLMCGKDYVNDSYEFIGWCSPDSFEDSVQLETIVHYFESESLTSVLEEYGYSACSLPERIYDLGDIPDDADLLL